MSQIRLAFKAHNSGKGPELFSVMNLDVGAESFFEGGSKRLTFHPLEIQRLIKSQQHRLSNSPIIIEAHGLSMETRLLYSFHDEVQTFSFRGQLLKSKDQEFTYFTQFLERKQKAVEKRKITIAKKKEEKTERLKNLIQNSLRNLNAPSEEENKMDSSQVARTFLKTKDASKSTDLLGTPFLGKKEVQDRSKVLFNTSTPYLNASSSGFNSIQKNPTETTNGVPKFDNVKNFAQNSKNLAKVALNNTMGDINLLKAQKFSANSPGDNLSRIPKEDDFKTPLKSNLTSDINLLNFNSKLKGYDSYKLNGSDLQHSNSSLKNKRKTDESLEIDKELESSVKKTKNEDMETEESSDSEESSEDKTNNINLDQN